MKYLTAQQILFIHARVIEETGGAHGVRYVGFLESAAGRPRVTFGGIELYPDAFRKAAALAVSLARNRCFIDGNKRTSIAAAGLFLGANGFRLQAAQKELVRFAINLAVGKLAAEKAAAWFQKHCTISRT